MSTRAIDDLRSAATRRVRNSVLAVCRGEMRRIGDELNCLRSGTLWSAREFLRKTAENLAR